MNGVQLKIGIIGAGITGLCSAIALRRAGHDVELYERSEFNDETGAAITMTPNASRLLAHWGFDADKAQGTDYSNTYYYGYNDGSLNLHRDFTHQVRKVKGRYVSFHRVDMHQQLRNLATAAGAKLNLAAPVVGMDCEEGEILMQNGDIIRRDLIVVADGINTRLLQFITGTENPGRIVTGKSMHRALVPMGEILADPVASQLFEDKPPSYITTNISGNGNIAFCYPCRNNTWLNLGLVYNSDPGAHREWNTPTNRSDMMDAAEGIHETFRAVLSHAKDVRTYSMDVRRALDHWTRGRAVIVGDAAHGMYPIYASGGAMGVEDAAAFEPLFSGLTSRDDVPARLQLYEQVRLPRANTVQVLSNTGLRNDLVQNDYLRKLGEDRDASVGRHYQGPIPQDKSQWSDDICNFLYPYDVLAESRKALHTWASSQREATQTAPFLASIPTVA